MVFENLARKLVYLAMLDKEIHVHVHTEKDCEVISLLKEIRDLLKGDDEEITQRIMDKLNKLNEDIKSTIQ